MSTALIGILLVIVSTSLEGFGQVFLKKSTRATPLRRLWLALGIAAFSSEAVTWTGALRHLDVSIAFPMGGLSYVAVTILSTLMLGERVTNPRWLGVSFIIVGAALLGGGA
jgi:drug/metabolite transporter (DMT)-like permease